METPAVTPAFPLSAELALFQHLPDQALVRISTVCNVLGLSRASVYRYVKEGRIPAPLKLSPRATRWKVGDLRRATAELQPQAA